MKSGGSISFECLELQQEVGRQEEKVEVEREEREEREGGKSDGRKVNRRRWGD